MAKKKVKKVVAEPEPEPEPEVVAEPEPEPEVEYRTTAKGRKKVKKVRVVEPEPFEWLEPTVSDKELEEIEMYADKYTPEDIGVEFMIQLVARGSTVATAKKKWRDIHKGIHDDTDFINVMKKE